MNKLLTIPSKKTWEVDLIRPISKYIDNVYGSTKPADIDLKLKEFDSLRNLMIKKQSDRHEGSLEIAYRYFDQVSAVQLKLPVTENEIRIQFKWQDAFRKTSYLGRTDKLSICSSAFEELCVLFNIAAMSTQVAEAQNFEDDGGLKQAAKYFQHAASILSHLKSSSLSVVGREPTDDLQPDVLSALSSLCIAQAQEAVYIKTVNTKMKEGIIARVAMQLSQMYDEAHRLMQISAYVKAVWPTNWLNIVSAKAQAFHGIAELNYAAVCKAEMRFGEQISRLQHAKELLSLSVSRIGSEHNFSSPLDSAKKFVDQAKRDNDLIYHNKIPAVSDLTPIEKTCLVKIQPFVSPLSSNFEDLFQFLQPLAVQSSVSQFQCRQQALLNHSVARMRDATSTMNGILTSLNLPMAIEESRGDVPQSILEKAVKAQSEKASSHISDLMVQLPELLNRNSEILAESFRLLDEEESSDSSLKEQFKDRWNRTPSGKLTEPLRVEGTKYSSIISNAKNADEVVRDKFNKCKRCLDMLSEGKAGVQAALPTASSAGANNSPAKARLITLMNNVEAIKNERDVMENQFKEVKCDHIGKLFLDRLNNSGMIEEESISEQELEKLYGELKQQLDDSLVRQEHLMEDVQSAHADLMKGSDGTSGGTARMEMLKELASSYDTYQELKSNLEEGTKFYNDLTLLTLRFQTKVSDFCFARKTEKEELMKDLQSSIVSQPSGVMPEAPKYKKGVKPSRPPPPPSASLPASSSAPPPAAAQTPPNPIAAGSYAGAYPPVQQPGTYPPVQQPGAYPPVQQPGAYPPAQQPSAVNYQYPTTSYFMPPMPASYNPYAPQQYPYYPPQPYPSQGGAYPNQPPMAPSAYPGAQPPYPGNVPYPGRPPM